jgi:Flp pilus assembly protein TadD
VDSDAATLNHIEALLRSRRSEAAERAAHALTSRSACVEGHILLGRALQQQGKFHDALRAAETAKLQASQHPAAVLLAVECLLQLGDMHRGLAQLRSLERDSVDNSRVLQDVGSLYTHLNLLADAERCFARAAALVPADPQALYNWATCMIGLGRLDEAEQLLTRVIALAPNDHDAYYNRATLRRQTLQRNHVAEIERELSRPAVPPAGRVALGYALAKELEDLGRYGESFAVLKPAADARRELLSYRVLDDTAAMADVAREFGFDYCRGSPDGGYADPRPIFIVGLPRSGTTLVDRILSSHTLVHSRGESSDLAATIMRLAGPVRDKSELIRRSARLDAAELGRSYCTRLAAGAARHVIDKTPINFLYIGLIAAALPQARIIHVRRQPLDVCYAMYKTLFRMAYPFSYDFADLAHYYLAYAALMQHWRTLLGGRLIELDYEALVSDQEKTTRRLLEACELPWEDDCLEFHRNRSPSLTASAAQIRVPIYNSSVGLWRRYQRELQPLADMLGAVGVGVGGVGGGGRGDIT